MVQMKVAALLGDVVDSRRAVGAGRAVLHARLQDALTRVNAEPDPAFAPVVPLHVTVGDEYQACFATVGAALRATLRLSLLLAPEVEVRHGIGWGAVDVLQDEPRIEDGPAWWAARAAIEEVEGTAARAAYRSARTWYARAEDGPGSSPGSGAGPDPAPVNAALLLRDQQVAALSVRSGILLAGLLAGRTQRELAESEGVSASAMSQRVRRDGVEVLVRSDALLAETR